MQVIAKMMRRQPGAAKWRKQGWKRTPSMPSLPSAEDKQVALPRGKRTIGRVTGLIQLGMHILTILFFVGLAGSSVVVVLSFIEDLYELLGE
jgi:hypothetical protein